jgi:hypothetical protein
LSVATRGDERVLVIGTWAGGEEWAIQSRPTVIGGTPFGAWTDRDGRLEHVPVTAIAGAGTHGDLLLDLVSVGPGVVHDFDAVRVRALAKWIESLPILGA